MIDRGRFGIASGYIMKWCVMAIVFAAPFSKSIAEIAIVIGIAALVAEKSVNGPFRPARTDLDIPILIFLVAILPSFINSGLSHLSTKALFTKVLKYAGLYYVIVEGLDTESKLKDLFGVVVLSAAIILLDAWGQYLWRVDALHNYPAFQSRAASEGFFRGFPTACFPFPNDFAAWILLVIFPIASAALFDLRRNAFRYAAAVLSFGLFQMLFMTKTRAAWIGFALSTFYLALAKRKAWLILLLVITVAIPFVLKTDMAVHLASMSSVTDRTGMWRVGWEIFKQHPVIGNGLNTFFIQYRDHRTDELRGQRGSYAHNCYLQMACDVGIVGLFGFLAFVAAYFVSIVRNMRNIRDPLLNSVLLGISVGVFAFLVLAFFDTNLYSLNLVTLFWCAVGISQAIIKVSRQEAA